MIRPARPEVVAFLKAMKDHPNDDMPCLIFADWLAEQNDLRGEFIRALWHLVHLEPNDPYSAIIRAKAVHLQDAFQFDWLGPLAALAAEWSFPRGLVWARIPSHRLGTLEEQLLDTETLAWVDGLTLNISSLGGTTIDSAVFADLRELTLTNLLDGNEVVGLLARSTHLRQLQRLALPQLGLHTVAMRFLAQSATLAQLTSLNLERNRLTSPGVQALVQAPFWSRLRSLRLRDCALSDADFLTLFTRVPGPQLTSFDLAHNQFGRVGMQGLISSRWLATIEGLQLAYNSLRGREVELLALSAQSSRLRELALRGNRIGPEGAQALAQATHLTELRVLDLFGCLIGDAGASALADAAHLANLTRLNLVGNQMTDAGALALARSPYLSNLRALFLLENSLQTHGQQALLERFGSSVVYF